MHNLATYEILGAVSLFAGFISAIAGSSGLIILPMLLIAGVPPQLALGTNKLYTTTSLMTSAICFMRKGLFRPRYWVAAIIASIFGSITGVALMQIFSNEALKMLLPILIGLMALYLLLPKKRTIAPGRAAEPACRKSMLVSSGLGIYSGFLGAGTGSLWTSVATGMFKMDIMEASAISRFMCFTTNFVALLIFMGLSQVNYAIGLELSICGSIGAYLGSKLAIRWGAKFMRTMLVSSTLVMACNLAVTNWA